MGISPTAKRSPEGAATRGGERFSRGRGGRGALFSLAFLRASYVTSDASRITVARDGLQELFDESNDGKTVVFIVKIGNKLARKSAVMRYVA